jgi:hypothetical protein
LKLSSAKLSHFSNICHAFGAIMYPLEPKGGRGGGIRGLMLLKPLSSTEYCTVSEILRHKIGDVPFLEISMPSQKIKKI